MIGCPTHWFGGRTVPCEAHNCQACLEGTPWRWHGYLGALKNPNRQHVIVEWTAQAADQINRYRTTHPSLRNAIITARRHRNQRNGTVIVELTTGDPDKLHLPDPPDLIKCLSILWNIPTPDMTPTTNLKNTAAIKIHTGGNHEKIVAAIAHEQRQR